MSPADRFWSKVDKSGHCWVWTASTNKDGYGRFNAGHHRIVLAHRYAYELVHGPSATEFDHACHNPACVRLDGNHVRPITRKQNNEHRRGAQSNNRSSGIRGVSWSKEMRKWEAHATHHGKKYCAGHFDSLDEAEDAAKRLRNQLFTHNGVDRQAA